MAMCKCELLSHCVDMTEDAYHFENPYHNSTHATDVLQALHCLLQEQKVCVCLVAGRGEALCVGFVILIFIHFHSPLASISQCL